MQSNDEDPGELIKDCIDRQSKLTDWEVNFISSLDDQLTAGRTLSARQLEILGRIWDKVT